MFKHLSERHVGWPFAVKSAILFYQDYMLLQPNRLSGLMLRITGILDLSPSGSFVSVDSAFDF